MGQVQRTRYDGVAMIIHWVTAALMIFMVFFGEELMEGGEAEETGEALAGTFGPSLHVSLGVAILALTIVRLLWRLGHQAPAYPPDMKRWEIGLSHAVHALFYVLMIALPITGWLAFGELVREEPAMAVIKVFGAFPLPVSPEWGDFAEGPHKLGSKIAMALIALHVLAALKHQFLDRDGIMARMRPV